MKKVLLYIFALVLFTSCDRWGVNNILHPKDKNVTVKDLVFSDNYEKINVRIDDIGELSDSVMLDDTAAVDVEVQQNYCYIAPIMRINDCKLEKVTYVRSKELKAGGFDCLVLVDLCQTADLIQLQKEYVKSIYRYFNQRNLFLAFMLPGGKVTNVIAATDYVIDNYITANASILNSHSHFSRLGSQMSGDSINASIPHAYLYRSVCHMLDDTFSRTGTTYDGARRKSLVVLSDGVVYNDENLPVDPQHFQLQEKLMGYSRHMPSDFRMYYVSLSDNDNDSHVDNTMMRLLCEKSKGRYIEDFNTNTFQENLAVDFNYPMIDYVVTISVRPGNVYFGNERRLTINFRDKKTDKVIAHCSYEYALGAIDKPVVVGDYNEVRLYVTGAAAVLLFLGILYLILQIVIPYIRYHQFQKKYIHKYTGPNMGVGGLLVADHCFYCKAEFRVGDDIVTKCQHTMHLDCWEENGQHCPEYGTHCPDGSHYYNHSNILDPLNSNYFLKWIMLACNATALALLTLVVGDFTPLYHNLQDTIQWLVGGSNGKLEHPLNWYAASSMYISQVLAPLMAFFLTYVLSYAASFHRRWKYRLVGLFLRGLCALVATYVVFYLMFCINVAAGINVNIPLLNFIPWTAMTYIIAFLSLYQTRIKLNIRRLAKYGAIAGAIAAVIWSVVGAEETIIQILVSFFLLCVYAVAVAFTVAQPLPGSDHPFLHVTGEIKAMDIALYKWLKQSENAIVTIGRSPDCSLQLVWDSLSDLAPVHAQIWRHRGIVYLQPVDGSVLFNDRPLKENEKVNLYHGDIFRIGSTTFTFMES